MIFFSRKPRVTFTISLAEIPIEVHAFYRQTKAFCREYVTDDSPVISVSVSRNDIRKERELDKEQNKKDGHPYRPCSVSYLETLALCRKVMTELMAHHVLLFHGAVVAVDGKAYLFTAKSGTGKTTHCRLWLKNIPESHILNGDKPLLKFQDGKVYACGSPWMGKENYGVNEILPLERICLLERDTTNHIEEITLKDSFERLMNQSFVPDGNGNLLKAVSMIKKLAGVKLYRLCCNMEDEAALVAYQTIVEKEV